MTKPVIWLGFQSIQSCFNLQKGHGCAPCMCITPWWTTLGQESLRRADRAGRTRQGRHLMALMTLLARGCAPTFTWATRQQWKRMGMELAQTVVRESHTSKFIHTTSEINFVWLTPEWERTCLQRQSSSAGVCCRSQCHSEHMKLNGLEMVVQASQVSGQCHASIPLGDDEVMAVEALRQSTRGRIETMAFVSLCDLWEEGMIWVC